MENNAHYRKSIALKCHPFPGLAFKKSTFPSWTQLSSWGSYDTMTVPGARAERKHEKALLCRDKAGKYGTFYLIFTRSCPNYRAHKNDRHHVFLSLASSSGTVSSRNELSKIKQHESAPHWTATKKSGRPSWGLGEAISIMKAVIFYCFME